MNLIVETSRDLLVLSSQCQHGFADSRRGLNSRLGGAHPPEFANPKLV